MDVDAKEMSSNTRSHSTGLWGWLMGFPTNPHLLLEARESRRSSVYVAGVRVAEEWARRGRCSGHWAEGRSTGCRNEASVQTTESGSRHPRSRHVQKTSGPRGPGNAQDPGPALPLASPG